MSLINRQARVEKQIGRELMPIVLAFGSSAIRASLQIKQIKISKDLSYAKVFVAFGFGQDPQQLLAQLNREKPFYRKALAKKIALKKMPDLKFYLDEMSQIEAQSLKIMAEISSSVDRC